MQRGSERGRKGSDQAGGARSGLDTGEKGGHGGGGHGGRGRGGGGRGGYQQRGGPQRREERAERGEGTTEKRLATIHLITNMFKVSNAAVSAVAAKVSQYTVTALDIVKLDDTGVPIPRKTAPKKFTLNKEEMREIVLDIGSKFNVVLANDGTPIVYTLGRLEDAIHRQLSLEKTISNITLDKGEEDSTIVHLTRLGKRYTLQLKIQEWDPSKHLTQMLQVAVQFSFFVKAKVENRKYYLPSGRIFLDDEVKLFDQRNSDLMLLRGIFESFRFNAANEPMVNVDVSFFPAVRDDISVYDVLCMHASKIKKTLEQALKDDKWVKRINGYIMGKRAFTTYNNVTYTLDHLGMEGNKMKTARTAMFEPRGQKKKPSKMISVLEYTTSTIGVRVNYPDQPVIVTHGKGNIMLLPELLRFVFGASRELDEDEPATVISMARNEPVERFRLIDESAQNIRNSQYWQNFGINILDKHEVDGKLLPTYQLTYANAPPVVPRDGTWNLDGKKLLDTPVGKQNWAVVYPVSRYSQTDTLVKNFVALSHSSGYDVVQEPVWIEVQQEVYENYVSELKRATPDTKAQGVKFYLIILPDKSQVRYRKIKEACHTELGIVTQCVVLDKFEPKGKISKTMNKSVLANIIAAINSKLRYHNCIITPDQLSNCLGSKVDRMIVMGLDVFHGDTNEQKKEPKPSIVALCAATNEHFTKYTFAFRAQIRPAGQAVEVVQDLSSMVEEVMKEYLKEREMPREILFYRDGVGETMYKEVKDTEIKALMDVMDGLALKYDTRHPKLTFVVVPKRVHMRTYASSTPKGNPPPGTLIDDRNVIDVGPDNFYLYSHKAIIGTAKPTHYIVVENENKFSVLQLAEFTYALAHLHQGCTKAVSLPAPVFYADRACGVVGECFRFDVDKLDKDLKHTLFMI